MALLILLTSAMGGTWLLEQPRSSIIQFHPRIRWLWAQLPKVGGWKICLVGPKVMMKNKFSLNYILYQSCLTTSGGWFPPKRLAPGMASSLVDGIVWSSNSKKAYCLFECWYSTGVGSGQDSSGVAKTTFFPQSQKFQDIYQFKRKESFCWNSSPQVHTDSLLRLLCRTFKILEYILF